MLIFNSQKLAKMALIAGLTISAQISIAQTNDTIPDSQLGEVMVTAQAALLLQKRDLFRKS
jgi:iron complex outermembrane receptor protein